MPAYHKFHLSFSAGELSPFLTARIDQDKYEAGCQRLENFSILPYGGLMRRPGTQFLGNAKFANKPCRLIGFNFSVTTNFILEFGELYVRFWANGAQVLAPSTSNPLEVTTSYLASEVREIQYCQINDLMYLTHPNHPPAKLTRKADDDWTFTDIVWTWPPTLEENTANVTITPSATTGNISLTASSAIFKSQHVGSYWQLGHRRDNSYVEVPLGATSGPSGALYILGPWEFTTYGSWQGTVYIERLLPGGVNWEVLRTYNSASVGQRNVASTGAETNPATLRINFTTAGQAGTSAPLARLQAGDNRVYGVAKITSYSSATLVYATVTKAFYSTEYTFLWSEAAFSGVRGFARTVCLHEGRLVLGGTKYRPLALYGSKIDDFENFRYGALDDDAFSFTISSNESNPINWLVSSTKMLVGTAGDEWSIGATNTDQAMGPGNVDAKQQSSYGSAFLQAEVVNDVVIFTQRQGHKLREMAFNFEKDGWVSPDLTILSNHISGAGFAETAFAQQPDSIFWCITSDGQLVGLTYERDQKVFGWHRHTTDGEFESVATIYGGQNADEVWLSVRRTVNGQDVRYIERFAPEFRKYIDEENKEAWWYLDCAKRTISGTEFSHITGLSHLEGKTVGVMGDGANQPTRVVTGGAIDIQEPAKNVLVGLPYVSLMRPMNINIPLGGGDTVQGRKLRIHKMVGRFYKSLTCQYSGDDGKSWDEIYFRDRDDVMDDSPSAFTGDREFATGTNFRTFQEISMRQNRPFPLVLLAMIEWVNVYGE
jgi:hypothetical protein